MSKYLTVGMHTSKRRTTIRIKLINIKLYYFLFFSVSVHQKNKSESRNRLLQRSATDLSGDLNNLKIE